MLFEDTPIQVGWKNYFDLQKPKAEKVKQQRRLLQDLSKLEEPGAAVVSSDRCVSIGSPWRQRRSPSRRSSSAFNQRLVGVASSLVSAIHFPAVHARLRRMSRWERRFSARRLTLRKIGMASDDGEAQEARETQEEIAAEEDLRIFETLRISTPRKVNHRHTNAPWFLSPVRSYLMHVTSRTHIARGIYLYARVRNNMYTNI